MEQSLLATTVPGLEAVALEEIAELTGRQGWVEHRGLVGVEGDEDVICTLNIRARSLFRVHVIVRRGRHAGLEGLYAQLRQIPFPDLLSADQSFAVWAARQGEHGFSSQDAGGTAGQAIIDAYRESRGQRPPVNLNAPEVIFRLEVRDERFWLAMDTTGKRSLAERDYRLYQHRAALKPPIAYALVRLSGWREEERLLDPMCGSATVLIEADAYARGLAHRRAFAFERYIWHDPARLREARERIAVRQPALRLRGYEVSERHLAGARQNIAAAGAAVDLQEADARTAPLDAERIVVNVPYGIRMGSPRKVGTLYAAFGRNLRRAHWKRLVVITARPKLFARNVGLEVKEAYETFHGGLYTHVLVFEGGR